MKYVVGVVSPLDLDEPSVVACRALFSTR
jgi:hypothetical protein